MVTYYPDGFGVNPTGIVALGALVILVVIFAIYFAIKFSKWLIKNKKIKE